jgi:hypothetical protein
MGWRGELIINGEWAKARKGANRDVFRSTTTEPISRDQRILYENPHSVQPITRPRFELSTSRIKIYSLITTNACSIVKWLACNKLSPWIESRRRATWLNILHMLVQQWRVRLECVKYWVLDSARFLVYPCEYAVRICKARWVSNMWPKKTGASLQAVVKREKNRHCPCCRESNPRRPARSLVTTLTNLPCRNIHIFSHAVWKFCLLVLSADRFFNDARFICQWR